MSQQFLGLNQGLEIEKGALIFIGVPPLNFTTLTSTPKIADDTALVAAVSQQLLGLNQGLEIEKGALILIGVPPLNFTTLTSTPKIADDTALVADFPALVAVSQLMSLGYLTFNTVH